MINEEKVKIMNRLAMYEKVEGRRKYLPVSKYYRSDYVGLALIKNFFLVTIGYGLIIGCDRQLIIWNICWITFTR